MPVTEIATFQLVAPNNLHSEPLATLLGRGIRNQITYSSTPVYLFIEAADASSVYLISGWPSIEKHHESGGSAENREVMGQVVPALITFKGLVHPAIDFSAFPSDVSVVVVEKYVVGEGEDGLGAIKDISAHAKWAQSGVDENGEGYRLFAYGPEEGVAVLQNAEAVRALKGVILKRALSFEVEPTKGI